MTRRHLERRVDELEIDGNGMSDADRWREFIEYWKAKAEEDDDEGEVK